VANDGNTFSTDHQGTEALLFSPTLNTTDSYNFGVSFRFIPRTSINYDQFYTYFKGDTTSALAPQNLQGIFGIPGFTLAGGLPVNLGIAYNTVGGQPCATPVLAQVLPIQPAMVISAIAVLAGCGIHSPRNNSASRANIFAVWTFREG
jgi:hypothetical protein